MAKAPEPLNPEDVSIYTVRANLCYDGRQRGTDWCGAHCTHKCEWGIEYDLRQKDPMRDPSRRRRKKKAPNYVEKGRIPHFLPWLRDYMAVNDISRARLARMSGMSQSRVSVRIRQDWWSRDFEKHVMAGLGMDEGTVTELAARWAEDHGVTEDEGEDTYA